MEMTCAEAQRLQVPCKRATLLKESTVPAVCLMTFRQIASLRQGVQMLFRQL